MNKSRNVLSEKSYTEELLKPFKSDDFVMDLQLFGHSSDGKSGSKIAFTLLGAALGGWAGAVTSFAKTAVTGAILGASLVSTIWSATHQPNLEGETGSPEVQRFDRAQETMSSDGQIPVVYGYRKITGNQTFHATNAEANQLHKHVILCEGGIEGIVSVTANNLLIPTGNQSEGTVFTITNTKYKDAKVWKEGKTLYLLANGVQHSIYLCNTDDGQSGQTFYEWQTNVNALIAYINKMGDGFEAFPYASTSKYPADLKLDATLCYMNPANVTAATVVGGTKYTFYDGEPPENFNEVGGYPNMAWLDMYFNSSAELNGNPSVEVIVKGKKVYDPRTKKVEYSTNPAMCLRDFLLSKRYGIGRWISEEQIDNDSFCQMADYCDEVIDFSNGDGTTTKAKRFELNMVIDQKQSALSWVQEILANFSAYLTYANGKYKLCVERPQPVSFSFTDDNISDLAVSPISLDETPNRYDVKIIDPKNDWKSVSCLCEDYADQKERGKVISKTIQLNGTTSQHQALRLARFYRDYNLVCPLQFSFSTGLQAMHLEAGDIVTISYRDVWEKIPIRIAEIREDENGKYSISGRQYNESLYTDNLGGGVHWHSYEATPDPESKSVTPPNSPSNLKAEIQYRRNTDGKTNYEIEVSYQLPRRWDVTTGLVYYRSNAISAEDINVFKEGETAEDVGLGREWKYAGESPRSLHIPNVRLGNTYTIRVISKAMTGLTSDSSKAPEITVKVTPKQTVPAMPHNIRYDFSERFYFEWDDVADSDAIYYEVRLNDKVGYPDGLLGRTNDSHIVVNLSARKGVIYVYAVNGLKKHSYPATCHWYYPKPNAPDYIDFAETPRGMNIKLPFFPSRVHKARLYISGTKSSDVIETLNPVYEFKGEPSVYSIRACWVDLIGEGYSSFEYSFTINPTFKPEWIEDGSLSIKKMDKAVADSLNKVKKNAKDILSINESITELQIEDGSIRSLVTNVENKTASQIKQLSDDINITVANGIDNLAASIDVQAGQISSIVTALGGEPEEGQQYSAITQLVDGINARVEKGDVINQINLTAEGTTIDGKYLHITGETLFEKDVIVGGMIKSGSITADKLSANTIALTGKQGITGGAATLDAKGLTVATKNGSVSFDSDGMSFKDKNGQAFSVVGRFLTGIAQDGQYVKFTKPWDVVPTVMLIPTTMQTGVASYSASNIYTKCYAENVSKDGFKVRCYSSLGAGSSGMVGINKVESVSIPDNEVNSHRISELGWYYDHMEYPEYYGDIVVCKKVGMLFNTPIPDTATNAVIRSVVKGFSYIWRGWDGRRYLATYTSLTVVIEYLANGKVIATDSTSSNTEVTILRNLSFPVGSTISIRVTYYARCQKDEFGHLDPFMYVFGGTSAKIDIESATVNVNADSVISRGTVAFLVTDTANKQYTIS